VKSARRNHGSPSCSYRATSRATDRVPAPVVGVPKIGVILKRSPRGLISRPGRGGRLGSRVRRPPVRRVEAVRAEFAGVCRQNVVRKSITVDAGGLRAVGERERRSGIWTRASSMGESGSRRTSAEQNCERRPAQGRDDGCAGPRSVSSIVHQASNLAHRCDRRERSQEDVMPRTAADGIRLRSPSRPCGGLRHA